MPGRLMNFLCMLKLRKVSRRNREILRNFLAITLCENETISEIYVNCSVVFTVHFEQVPRIVLMSKQ